MIPTPRPYAEKWDTVTDQAFTDTEDVLYLAERSNLSNRTRYGLSQKYAGSRAIQTKLVWSNDLNDWRTSIASMPEFAKQAMTWLGEGRLTRHWEKQFKKTRQEGDDPYEVASTALSNKVTPILESTDLSDSDKILTFRDMFLTSSIS